MSRKRRPRDFVTCKHCGKKFRAVNQAHLRARHGYEDEHPVNEYKAEFGLRVATSLATLQKRSQARRIWTPDDVIAEIRRIHRSGHSLRPTQVPARLHPAGIRLFGSWEAAVRKAGLDYEKVSGIRHWTREKVIARIRKLAAAGIPLNTTYIRKNYAFLHQAAIRAFPSAWGKALRAAGFDIHEHWKLRCRWNRDRAEKWVRERHGKGRSILARDVPKDLKNFVHRRLGTSWSALVESLGIPYPGVKRRVWTKAKLLSEIRRWQAEGHRMNHRAVQSEYQALTHQARKFFGSWDAALAAARA